MGLHISSPDLVLNPSVILGQRRLFTPEEAELLMLPNLVNWWTAADAALASGTTTWMDRKSGQVLTGTSGTSPAITTVGDDPALEFNASGYLTGAASIPLTDDFTWLINMQPIASLATGVIVGGTRSADSNGPYMYMFSDGSIRGNVNAGQQGSSGAATIVAGTNVMVDWSWNGTTMQFGKNGAAGAASTPATSGAAPTPDGFVVGAGKSGSNPLKAYVYDIIQFNANMRDGDDDHAAQLATAIAKLQLRLA